MEIALGNKGKTYRLLLGDDYALRLTSLHEEAAKALAEGQDEKNVIGILEEAEWDLTIDHRIGQDIPESMRRALHEFKLELNKRRDELVDQYTRGQVSPLLYVWRLNRIPRKLARQYMNRIPNNCLKRILGPFSLLPIDLRILSRGRKKGSAIDV